MNMKTVATSLLAAVIGFTATFAWSATPGDQTPAASFGWVLCPNDGGSALVPFMPNQNAIAVRNFLTDGGTSANIYLGWDAGVNNRTGFPLKPEETLSLDIVAITKSSTLGLQPKLYCSSAPAGTWQELHYISVK